MAWASKSFTFSPSTVIASAEVNQNFDDIVAGLNTAMPSGGIIMWSGAVASIPSGWFLCDGNNGTPNLVNRFIVGAGSSYNVGATGGEASHTLTIAEMPSHNHGGVTGDDSLAGRVGPVVVGSGSSREETNPGSHNHTITAEGGGQAHNNLPPYYALAYIMKS